MAQHLPSFPSARQAQISAFDGSLRPVRSLKKTVRANQRDLFHVVAFKEQADAVLRAWLGTRWLLRWDKEVDLALRLLYYGVTIGRAVQTLGEEYTDIWQQSAFTGKAPSRATRIALVLLPTLPPYILARWGAHLGAVSPSVASVLRVLPTCVEVAAEVNLAVFYLRGTYYDLTRRILGIQHMSPTPENPHVRPPSYSLLGILILVRLLYRLIHYLRSRAQGSTEKSRGKRTLDETREMFLDDRLVSTMLDYVDPDKVPVKPAEEDENTVLDVRAIPARVRASRTCTLCLEERTDSCATECGHLFCWNCIVGWGREKAECPLCRQALNLTRLLPIHNL